MYANNIRILATQTGMGVLNYGNWQAGGGQITVTSEGFLRNTGTISASAVSVATAKGNLDNAGTIQGSDVVVLSAGGDTRLSGAGLQQTAGSTLFIHADGAVNFANGAQVSSTSTGGRINVSAGQNINFDSGSTVAAHGDVQLSSDAAVSINGASVTSSSGNVTALAGSGMNVTYANVTGQQVHLETGAAFKETSAPMTIIGGRIRGEVQTTALATGNIQIASPGSTAVSSGGNVHIQATKSTDIMSGSLISAGQHMSVMAGEVLNLQAASGSTATNGQKVALNAGGNLLLSGGVVNATAPSLSAGQELSIEANEGGVSLQALANANGASVDTPTLTAGQNLNISAYKGNIFLSGVQATGQNVNVLSNGTTRVEHATTYEPGKTRVISSTLTARDGLTVGNISPTANNNQLQIVGSNLNAGGQAKLFATGQTLITAGMNTDNGWNNPVRSTVAAGSVSIQGSSIRSEAGVIYGQGDKSTLEKSGDIAIVATAGDAAFSLYGGYGTLLKSTGNIALHANGNLIHLYTWAESGGGLSSTSATGQINSTGSILSAKDVLSFASQGSQTHTSTTYTGGTTSIYNKTGHLALQSGTRVQAIGTNTASLATISGKNSIESGGTLNLDASSYLKSATDLSITQGSGDILINPANTENNILYQVSFDRGTFDRSQLDTARGLSLATRNGNILFSGQDGGKRSFGVNWYVPGDFNLTANDVTLQGTSLTAGASLNITATTGMIRGFAQQATANSISRKSTSWSSPQLRAGENLNLNTFGDINFEKINAQASGDLSIMSGGSILLSNKYDSFAYAYSPTGTMYQDSRTFSANQIQSGRSLAIKAMGGSLSINAADISALNGKATLQALGSVNLEAAQTWNLYENSTSGFELNCYLVFVCKTTKWTDYYHSEYLTNKPVNISAQGIEVLAGNTINTYGTKLNSGQSIKIEAGDNVNYYAVYDRKDENVKRNSTVGWGIGDLLSVRFSGNVTTDTRQQLFGIPPVLQSLGDILSNSGGDQLLQGTKVVYGGTAAFNPSVGEKARADARIILEGLKNTTTQTRTQEANYVVWQKMANTGSTTETLTLPSFSGPSKPVFNAPGGLVVQVPAGDLREQVSSLASQPGMGYLNDLSARPDVNWQPVKLAHEQWNYKQEGLTPAGAALLSVAVAWATAGQGAALLGTTGSTTTLMANAAFTSLASQAAITLVNNKGDVGKTLHDLSNSQTVKATLAAALTAGALEKIGGTATMKSLTEPGTGLSEKLAYNLINASGRALTNTAITGGSLEDALKGALMGGVVDTLHGQVASEIKGLESEYLAHKLAHALAGCAAGAAVGGSCQDGAIGSAVGEVVAQLLPPANKMFYTDTEKNNVLALSKLVAGATTAFAGGNAQTAITTAETAVQNNAFFVPPLVYWLFGAASAYATGVGQGNFVEGVKTLGSGKDPLSQAIAYGTQTAVSLSMAQFPKETTAVLNLLMAVGQQVDAAVTYADKSTGQVVSSQWNSLSSDTQAFLLGSGKIVSFSLSPVGVGQIKNWVTNAPVRNLTEVTKLCTGSTCFTAGTMVQTQTGLKAIETFVGGELVWSRDDSNHTSAFRPVVATVATPDQVVFDVRVVHSSGRHETLTATQEHPFWVDGHGWYKTTALQPGMVLQDQRQEPLYVVGVSRREELATVYNIEVEEFHTYYVGELGVWVHNANCCDIVTKMAVTNTDRGIINITNARKEGLVLDVADADKWAIDEIVKQRDIGGKRTEALVDKVLGSHRFDIYEDGKYGSNNGFDHVAVYKDPAGNTVMTLLVDSKQVNSKGIKLEPNAAGGNMQMTNEWIKAVLDKLDPNSLAKNAVEKAMLNNTLVKAVAFVDKNNSTLNMVRINPVNPQ